MVRPHILLLLVVWVGACTGTAPVEPGPRAKPEASLPALAAELGRIYFYRPIGLYGNDVRPGIFLSGTKVADSRPGQVYLVDVTPGRYEVSMPTVYPITIRIAPGQTQYVRTSVGGPAHALRLNIEQVQPAQAKKEIRDLSVIRYPQ